jgi:hypothetical protein
MDRPTRLPETTPPQRAARAPAAKNSGHAAPGALSPRVRLQRDVGNRAAGRLVQAKLKVGRPGDRFEREADRASDQVMGIPDGAPPVAIAGTAASGNAARDGAGGGADRAGSLPTPGPSVRAALSGGAGSPLPEAARTFFEPRLGVDLSAVRLHSGAAAGAAAAEIGAKAFTHGRDIYFGRGRFAPGSGEGRRLLAHELVHTVQQAGGSGGLIQADFESDFAGRPEIPVSESPLPPPGTVRVTRPDGERVWAPYGIYPPDQVPDPYQNRIMEAEKAFQWRNPGQAPLVAHEINAARGANAGELTVRDMTRLAQNQRRHGINIRVMMARVGNDYLFVGYDLSRSFQGGRVDTGFVESERGTALVGQRLLADRVVRALQSGAPVMRLEVHVSQRTADFHARIYQVIGRQGRPEQGASYDLSLREMIRLADAWSDIGDLSSTQRAELRRLAAGPSEPTSADLQRVLRGTPPPGRGGGTPPPPPAAPSGGGGVQGAPPTTATSKGPGSAGVQGGQSGRKPSPVSARDVAAEISRTMREVQRLEKMTRYVYWGLGAWQAVNALLDVAKSVNMATATLAQGSPYAAQIQQADTIESSAKEIAQYYGSIDLLALRMSEDDPSWGSYYDVYQAQLSFLTMEQSLYDALKDVQAARNNLANQMNAVRDEMASKTAATMFAVTSLIYAEVMLFADAGGKINARLLAASKQYAIAVNALEYNIGMTRALAQRHEMRLRELGSRGVFWRIPSDKIQSTDLDRFTFRR